MSLAVASANTYTDREVYGVADVMDWKWEMKALINTYVYSGLVRFVWSGRRNSESDIVARPQPHRLAS